MARLYCEVNEGLRPAEATITIREHDATPQHFPLDRGLVLEVQGCPTIPVFVLYRSLENGAALVRLPVEADSGDHSAWVALADLAPDCSRNLDGDDAEPHRVTTL